MDATLAPAPAVGHRWNRRSSRTPATLAGPAVRNRTMVVRALGGWPPGTVPDEVLAAVEHAHRIEPLARAAALSSRSFPVTPYRSTVSSSRPIARFVA
jgi:hypothetical protein